jgi:ATP-dependent 26S proteasome regulatory subunit
MKNIDQQPDEQIDSIPGKYADIYLGNPSQWHQFLNGDNGAREMYYGDQDDLPSPVKNASVRYWPKADSEDNSGHFSLTANVEFLPLALTDATEHPWQLAYISELRNAVEASGASTYTLRHEMGAFRARISTNLVACVTTSTDTDRCIVNIFLDEVDAQDKLHDTNHDGEPTDEYLVLKNYLSIWSQAIDTTVEMYDDADYGKHTGQHHIALNFADPVDKVQKQITQLPAERNGMLHNNELVNSNRITFDDIAGYDDIKSQLLDLALLNKHSELAESIGLTATHGILLHGAPGTAKTMLLKAFANEIDATLEQVSVSHIIEKYVGSSARNLDEYFEELIQRPEKIVVLMDEFDSIGVAAEHSSSSERTDTVNRLKEWVLNIGENHHNIIMTGATNNIDHVDKALVRPGRFLSIEVPMPNEQMRRQIWSMMLGKIGTRAAFLSYENPNAVTLGLADDIDTDALAQKSHGMVGAHFTEILNVIRKQRLRTYDQSKIMNPITQEELLQQIKKLDVDD